jgi:shikimate kinase
MASNLESKQIIWICGLPGSGKTWFGDYLATRGWHHVDGDGGGISSNEDIRAIWTKYMGGLKSFTEKGDKMPEEYWMP